jgi:hypothetical protein
VRLRPSRAAWKTDFKRGDEALLDDLRGRAMTDGIDVAFFGVLGKCAEAKTSANGNKYVRLSARGGSGDAATWISIAAFGDNVDELAELGKGDHIYCEGVLTATAWLDQRDGKAKPSLNVMAWLVQQTHRIGRAKIHVRAKQAAEVSP